MNLPRVLVTQHPVGRTLGAPHDAERQTEVIRAALRLLDDAGTGGTVVDFDKPYRTPDARRNASIT